MANATDNSRIWAEAMSIKSSFQSREILYHIFFSILDICSDLHCNGDEIVYLPTNVVL